MARDTVLSQCEAPFSNLGHNHHPASWRTGHRSIRYDRPFAHLCPGSSSLGPAQVNLPERARSRTTPVGACSHSPVPDPRLARGSRFCLLLLTTLLLSDAR